MICDAFFQNEVAHLKSTEFRSSHYKRSGKKKQRGMQVEFQIEINRLVYTNLFQGFKG